MLFPENPDKRLELWDSLRAQLARDAMCCVIANGLGNPDAEAAKMSDEECEATMKRLQRATVCRISASRGLAVAPHFAATLRGDVAELTELISYPSEGRLTVTVEQLRRDIETAVINLMYGGDGIKRVIVPLHIAPWEMRDAEIQVSAEGLLFTKKGN